MEAEPKAARRSRSPSLQGLRESRAEMTPPPRRMVMRHGGGTECERGVFRAKRKRERVLATPIERHQEVAEERFRGAEPLGGKAAQRRKRAGRGYMPVARVEHDLPLRQCILPPVSEHNLRAAQRYYHGSVTEPWSRGHRFG